MDSDRLTERININRVAQNIAITNGFTYAQHNDSVELTWAGEPGKPLLQYIPADNLVVLSKLEKHTARVLEMGLRGLSMQKREGHLSTGGFASLAVTVNSLADAEKLSEAVGKVFSQRANAPVR